MNREHEGVACLAKGVRETGINGIHDEPILTREELNPMTASNEKALEFRQKSHEPGKIRAEKGQSEFPPPRPHKKTGLKSVPSSPKSVPSPKTRPESTPRPLLKRTGTKKTASVKKPDKTARNPVKQILVAGAAAQPGSKVKEAPKTAAKSIAKVVDKPQKKQASHKETAAPLVKESSKPKIPPLGKKKTTSSPQTVSEVKTGAKAAPAKKRSPREALVFPTTRWGAESIISFEATEHYPPPELTSIVGGFVFHGGKVVLANVPGRGWEIVGGRIDIGETPEDTFRREARNQVGVTLSHIKMIGVVRIEHMGPEPPNCPYPYPIGYGVQFIGIVDQMIPFSGSEDSLGRSLISPEGFKEHYYDWNEYYEAVFHYAHDVYLKWRKKLKI